MIIIEVPHQGSVSIWERGSRQELIDLAYNSPKFSFVKLDRTEDPDDLTEKAKKYLKNNNSVIEYTIDGNDWHYAVEKDLFETVLDFFSNDLFQFYFLEDESDVKSFLSKEDPEDSRGRHALKAFLESESIFD